MTDTEKRLEAVLIKTIEEGAKDGCTTAEGVQALATVAQVLVILERG